jgi:hypothetical protein
MNENEPDDLADDQAPSPESGIDWRNGTLTITNEQGTVLFGYVLRNCKLDKMYSERTPNRFTLIIPEADDQGAKPLPAKEEDATEQPEEHGRKTCPHNDARGASGPKEDDRTRPELPLPS